MNKEYIFSVSFGDSLKEYPIITRILSDNIYTYYLFDKFQIHKCMRNVEKEERRCRRIKHKELSKQKFDILNNYTCEYLYNKSKYILVTVAFNNPLVIDYQIKLIKKFVKGSFVHIICDNSNEQSAAEEIRSVCISNNISYIHIDTNIVPNGYSDSHGVALNWIWKNILKKQEKDFALLDHDIFPVKEIQIDNYFSEQDFFGQIRYKNSDNKKDIWFLWPGFAFYNYNCVKNRKLNFRRYKKFNFIKVRGVDTGSANWSCLYSKYNADDLKACDCIQWDIENDCLYTKEHTETSDFNECVEYYDNKNWLHAINGSNWHYSNGKITLVYKILDELLQNR